MTDEVWDEFNADEQRRRQEAWGRIEALQRFNRQLLADAQVLRDFISERIARKINNDK